MKSFNGFIRTTLAGGILFLIPLIILLSVVRKAMDIINRLTAPWDDRLKGEILWGLDGHKIVAILLILTICFLAGLIFKVTIVKASISKLEANLLSYIPGYMMIKSMATDALGDSKQGVFIPIIIKEEDAQRLGFLVEERGDLCTVFLPDAPKSDAGEIRIISAASIIKLPIGVASMKHIIGNFGKGAFDSILNTK